VTRERERETDRQKEKAVENDPQDMTPKERRRYRNEWFKGRGDEIEVEERGRCCRRIINLDRDVEGVNYPEGGGGRHGTVNGVQRRE
jgi:hypothetical protein